MSLFRFVKSSDDVMNEGDIPKKANLNRYIVIQRLRIRATGVHESKANAC